MLYFKLSYAVQNYNLKTTIYWHFVLRLGVKPYACTMCDMRFFQRYHLQRHSLIHTGTSHLLPTALLQLSALLLLHSCSVTLTLQFHSSFMLLLSFPAHCHAHEPFCLSCLFSMLDIVCMTSALSVRQTQLPVEASCVVFTKIAFLFHLCIWKEPWWSLF